MAAGLMNIHAQYYYLVKEPYLYFGIALIPGKYILGIAELSWEHTKNHWEILLYHLWSLPLFPGYV